MYDVVVIGGGPGGYAAAIRASQLGGKVALVEASEMGGTCVNRGCIPAKVWQQAAKLLHWIRMANEFGIKASVEEVDLQAIVARKNRVAGDIRMGMEGLLDKYGVKIIKGWAALKNPREVNVDGTVLEAKNVILATGSSPDLPDIKGLEKVALIPDQVFEMTKVPHSVLIWGSESVEVEMANLLRVFGSRVYLATKHSRLLPKEDHGTSQRIAKALKDQGVELFTGFNFEFLQESESGYTATLSGTEKRILEVSNILVFSRKPNTTHLGLKQIGILLNEDTSIQVNKNLETSVPGLYAVGDAIGGWMLSHASSSMGVSAAENAMGKKREFPFHLIPRGIWTFPEVGAVGLSEEESIKRGIEIEVGIFPYNLNALAMVRNEFLGSVKIISDARFGEILGVHIVGPQATELVGEAVLAMQLESTVREFAYSIRVHPTFSEAVVDAARDAANLPLYSMKR